MKIATRIILSTVLINLLFVLFTGALLVIHHNNTQNIHSLLDESEPTLRVLDHLLFTIYEDNVLLQDYLLTETYTDASSFDIQLEHSSEQCEQISAEVENQILLERIQDKEVIRLYNTAILVYSSLEKSRDTLITLHKQELVDGIDTSADKMKTLRVYQQLLQNSSAYFTESIALVNQRNIQLQQDLMDAQSSFTTYLVLFLVFLIGLTVVSTYLLVLLIVSPVDRLLGTTRSFTSGNYTDRVKENSKLTELHQLEQQMNRVFTVIEDQTKKEPKIKHKLLASQYTDIIEFLKDSAVQGKAITMTDIKKQFKLTFPTVQSRVTYLEDQGYVKVEKQGRQKIISLI